MSTADWFALAAIAGVAVCTVRYLLKRRKHRHCKGCPYADMCGRECEKDGDKT